MNSNTKVTKALILAAGRGTRFLPITKIVPKEMLPIGNKPTLHYLLEECKNSGITDVAIVLREWGSLTEKYFAEDRELEESLTAKGKFELLKAIEDPALGMELTFIKQHASYPMGHGSPVLSAKDWIGRDNFAMLFCDDLVKSETPALKQLITAWQENPELAGITMSSAIPMDLIKSYSTIKFKSDRLNANVKLLEDYIEKPKTEAQIFSNQCWVGRAVYSADIVRYLEENLTNKVVDNGGEFSAWDAMLAMSKDQPVGVLEVDGEWLTTGNPEQMKIATQKILGW